MPYVAMCLLFVAIHSVSCPAQDVQLYVTFCLVHILRLHAPESPYDEAQLPVSPT
jgi:hypothetical protein